MLFHARIASGFSGCLCDCTSIERNIMILHFRKRIAILVLSIFCFSLSAMMAVLGDPSTDTAIEQVQPDAQSGSSSAIEPAVAQLPEGSPALPMDVAVQPALPNSPASEADIAVAPMAPADAQPSVAPPKVSTVPAPLGMTVRAETASPAADEKTALPTTPAPPKHAAASSGKPPTTTAAKAVQPPKVKRSVPAKAVAARPAHKPAAAASSPASRSASEIPGLISKIIAKTRSLISSALSWLGTRYIWGGSSRKGVDCSGLTQLLYKKEGVNLPHSAKLQYKKGKPVPRLALRPGDLVFFNTKGPLSHVGVYIGNNKFLHASNPKRGVRVDSLGSSYYSKRFAGARRYKSLG
jgi:cell wall-associated NlpC family hydrolase